MSKHITQQVTKGVLILTINRPEKRNALTQDMYQALTDGLEQASKHDDVRAVLIQGSNSCFTAGNDLKDFQSIDQPPEKLPVVQFLRCLLDFDKPLIAAAAGAAVGIGTTLLLHCDLVYAGEDTRFQLPFTHLGLVPEAGSSLLLPQLVGYPRAAELLLLGDAFDAKTAKQMGMINQVLTSKELLPFAKQQAQRIAALPTEAIDASRKLLRQPRRKALRRTLEAELTCFFNALSSKESKRAIKAALKRVSGD
ncbi:enoyl-CoA hydratase-related protein [Corallincola spongiicola]|uniref:Enoyl-CoA hydratase n=1 Tax=Corallincola spongiicola TaxID=2520508 RepID=A0ABY1WR84_9GAMM|nr:enoyl-CoA hydratase-related protein [Corallincola spongiicola]TAA47088.1 enoyl-CoA hydratase [Corallincola spongiicola]